MGFWLNFEQMDNVMMGKDKKVMPGKKVRRPCAYPGANLAKGWIENDDRAEAKAFAERALFTMLGDAITNWSRLRLYHVLMELGRKLACKSTLEEIRALIIELDMEVTQ